MSIADIFWLVLGTIAFIGLLVDLDDYFKNR